jgi:hypothetical protein
MKNYFLISFTLLFFILIESCTPYDEGPSLSFRPRTMRMRGSWKIYSFSANEADSMSYINRNHLEGIWNFDDASVTTRFGVRTDTNYYGGDYNSPYHNDISFIVYPYYAPPEDWIFKNDWDIIRLKNNDMKWRTTYKSKEYVIHFKRP